MDVRLCDFWAIYSERADDQGGLRVTGSFPGEIMVKAFFPHQNRPKGSWIASRVRYEGPMEDSIMSGDKWRKSIESSIRMNEHFLKQAKARGDQEHAAELVELIERQRGHLAELAA
jgi:hypothetical protein